MIRFRGVTKTYRAGFSRKVALNNANSDIIPRESLSSLGINGARKSPLIRLISGASITGWENLRFVCRIYDEAFDRMTLYAGEFSKIGTYMDIPVSSYSSGTQARLAFHISMAINFDIYLLNDITALGDSKFNKRCEAVFIERLKKSDIITISYGLRTLKKFCAAGCVLDGKTIARYIRIDDAIDAYQDVLAK